MKTLFIISCICVMSVNPLLSVTGYSQCNVTVTTGLNPRICKFSATIPTVTYAVTGSPNEYMIDWETLNDISWRSLPASPLPIYGIGFNEAVGSYFGKLYVRNTITGCVSQYTTVAFSVCEVPVVSLGPDPIACYGSSTASIQYNSDGLANQYMIDWEDLPDTGWNSIPANSSTLNISNFPSTPESTTAHFGNI